MCIDLHFLFQITEKAGRVYCWHTASKAELAAEWKSSALWCHHWTKVREQWYNHFCTPSAELSQPSSLCFFSLTFCLSPPDQSACGPRLLPAGVDSNSGAAATPQNITGTTALPRQSFQPAQVNHPHSQLMFMYLPSLVKWPILYINKNFFTTQIHTSTYKSTYKLNK